MLDYSKYIEDLIKIVKHAGEIILEIYAVSHQFKVQTKADDSPVTQADLLANEWITKQLKQLTPDIPIMSEEGRIDSFAQRKHWQYYWSVDPLDGTREFLSHSGEFTVNIALIKNHLPVLGIIYVPVVDECYFAFESAGAYKLDLQNQRVRIQTRKWPREQFKVLGSRGMHEERLQQRIGHLGDYKLVKMSSAWKFALIAEGRADFYPRMGDTCEWDTAAGQCILSEAGGALVDLNGEPLMYNSGQSVINSSFLAVGDKELLKQLIPFPPIKTQPE